jgi:hypothetical protein
VVLDVREADILEGFVDFFAGFGVRFGLGVITEKRCKVDDGDACLLIGEGGHGGGGGQERLRLWMVLNG